MSQFSILGSSGVIGGHLVSSLLKQGHDVYAPSRGDDEVFKRPLGHVIYCIGLTADFRSRPYETVESHVSHLSLVLQKCKFDSFLYLSTTRIYGVASEGIESCNLLVDPSNSSDFYNISKLMGEALCHISAKRNVRVVRLSNVIGGDSDNSPNFIPSLLRDARAGRIVLQSSLNSSKDYVHIDDVVSLLPHISLSGKQTVYNVASGKKISNAEWVEKMVAMTGCTVEVLPNAPQLDFADISIERVAKEFAFVPKDVLSSLSSASEIDK